MISPVQNSMFPFISQLISYINAAITQYASRHVQLYVWTNIMFFKSSSCKFIPRRISSVLIAKVLQVTFTGLVADRAIQRMIDQQEFDNSFSCIQRLLTRHTLHFHSIHYVGAATGNELWHRARIGLASF